MQKKSFLFFAKFDTTAQFKGESATIFQVQIKPDSTFVKTLKGPALGRPQFYNTKKGT